jgi:hypothetical protein
LRYMMWCHAALFSDRYYSLHDELYQRARQYAELDKTTGTFGQGVVNLSYCQAWILISIYESRMVFIPRAWVSIDKASRLSSTIGLDQSDGRTSPPKDWVEREERRRVFWMAFCIDLYRSIATGRPMATPDDVCVPVITSQ